MDGAAPLLSCCPRGSERHPGEGSSGEGSPGTSGACEAPTRCGAGGEAAGAAPAPAAPRGCRGASPCHRGGSPQARGLPGEAAPAAASQLQQAGPGRAEAGGRRGGPRGRAGAGGRPGRSRAAAGPERGAGGREGGPEAGAGTRRAGAAAAPGAGREQVGTRRGEPGSGRSAPPALRPPPSACASPGAARPPPPLRPLGLCPAFPRQGGGGAGLPPPRASPQCPEPCRLSLGTGGAARWARAAPRLGCGWAVPAPQGTEPGARRVPGLCPLTRCPDSSSGGTGCVEQPLSRPGASHPAFVLPGRAASGWGGLKRVCEAGGVSG